MDGHGHLTFMPLACAKENLPSATLASWNFAFTSADCVRQQRGAEPTTHTKNRHTIHTGQPIHHGNTAVAPSQHAHCVDVVEVVAVSWHLTTTTQR